MTFRPSRPRPFWSLLFAAGAGLATVVGVSFDPATYFSYHGQSSPSWRYPTGLVLLVCGFVIAEAAVTYGVFAFLDHPRSWPAALTSLVLLTPWWLVLSLAIVHSPGFYILHLLWLSLLLAALLAVTLFSATRHLVARFRAAHTLRAPPRA